MKIEAGPAYRSDAKEDSHGPYQAKRFLKKKKKMKREREREKVH